MTMNQVLTQSTQFFNQLEGELMLGLVIVGALLLCTLIMSIKKTRKLEKQLIRMQNELKVSNNSVINIGQQLLSLEKKVNKQNLSRSQARSQKSTTPKPSPSIDTVVDQPQTFAKALINEAPKQSVVDNNESVYDKARLYLAKGDSIENIAKRCNLSHAEVSLLKALSKNPATSL